MVLAGPVVEGVAAVVLVVVTWQCCGGGKAGNCAVEAHGSAL